MNTLNRTTYVLLNINCNLVKSCPCVLRLVTKKPLDPLRDEQPHGQQVFHTIQLKDTIILLIWLWNYSKSTVLFFKQKSIVVDFCYSLQIIVKTKLTLFLTPTATSIDPRWLQSRRIFPWSMKHNFFNNILVVELFSPN